MRSHPPLAHSPCPSFLCSCLLTTPPTSRPFSLFLLGPSVLAEERGPSCSALGPGAAVPPSTKAAFSLLGFSALVPCALPLPSSAHTCAHTLAHTAPFFPRPAAPQPPTTPSLLVRQQSLPSAPEYVLLQQQGPSLPVLEVWASAGLHRPSQGAGRRTLATCTSPTRDFRPNYVTL